MVKGKTKQQKIMYTCDVCGKEYKNTGAAEKCELSHGHNAGSGVKGFFSKLFRR